MNQDYFIELSGEAIKVGLLIAAPMLAGALIIGLLVSIFQAVTQINEQTLTFIPKILVILGALIFFSPFMVETMTSFTQELITSIPSVVMTK